MQCQGMTKSGVRCRRICKNSYCFQHQTNNTTQIIPQDLLLTLPPEILTIILKNLSPIDLSSFCRIKKILPDGTLLKDLCNEVWREKYLADFPMPKKEITDWEKQYIETSTFYIKDLNDKIIKKLRFKSIDEAYGYGLVLTFEYKLSITDFYNETIKYDYVDEDGVDIDVDPDMYDPLNSINNINLYQCFCSYLIQTDININTYDDIDDNFDLGLNFIPNKLIIIKELDNNNYNIIYIKSDEFNTKINLKDFLQGINRAVKDTEYQIIILDL